MKTKSILIRNKKKTAKEGLKQGQSAFMDFLREKNASGWWKL